MLAPRCRVLLASRWIPLVGLAALTLAGCASPWSLDPAAAPDEAIEEAADDSQPTGDADAADDAAGPDEDPQPQLPDRETAAKLRRDLSSPQAMARVAVLEKLVQSPPDVVPAEVIEARADPDARVRAKALEVVAAVAAADAMTHLARGLHDESRDVRHAAMRGLGKLGSDESLTKLRELWKREPEATRVVLVEALAESRDLETVLQAAEDKVWQVRAAAAPAVAKLGHDAICIAALERLAADASSVVQAAAVDAVSGWPLDAAGTVWLAAMEHGGMKARLAAQRQLARAWPSASTFDPEANRDLRIRQIVELRGQWQSRRVAHPLSTPARIGTVAEATRPEVSQALDELAAEAVSARRLAAKSLAVAAHKQPLGPAACRRLDEYLARETDAEVWRAALEALSGDASPDATRIALLGSGHAEGDIRRRACVYFAAHPAPEAAVRLAELLRDTEVAVQRAAAEALGGCASADECQALLDALGSRDGPLRVAAAVSLARLDHASGLPALERLARDPDLNVRLAAVRALGEQSDPAAQGALVDLLDEPHGVGVAALRSLRKSAEDEATGAAPVQPDSQDAEIAQWRRWWREKPAQR